MRAFLSASKRGGIVRARRFVAVAVTVVLPVMAGIAGIVPGSQPAPASAGTLPSLLDDNRGSLTNLGLVNLISGAYQGFPLFLSLPEPLGISLPPTPIITQDDQGPRVLEHPQIVNLYYDQNWDADNPTAPTTAQIDQWTRDLVGSSYFDAAGQYGVGAASFSGSDQANGGSATFCGSPTNGIVSLVTLTGWVSCEAGYGRILTQGDPLTGVPGPNKNTLYVVYVPPADNILENNNCQWSGLHWFSAAYATIFRLPEGLIPVDQNYPFAVVDANCTANFQALQADASHEIIEASTNPFIALGWLNNSDTTFGSSDFSNIGGQIGTLLSDGEAGDICSVASGQRAKPPVQVGTVGPAPAFLHPTDPVTLPVNDPTMGNGITVAPYWSNADGQCMPTQATMTSVTTSASPSVFGQDVTFTATVASSPPAGPAPDGQVDFFDGSSLLGTGTLSGGQATLSTSSLAVGDHPDITARYEGQGSSLASTSSPVDQTVNQAPTGVAVSSSADPSVFGQAVTFTATVSPAGLSTNPAAQPSGTVQFFDGSTMIGSGTLGQASPDQATFTTTSLAVGDHPDITATYPGDTNYLANSSPSFDQAVSKAPTVTTVTGAPNSSTWGQSVTFTAIVGPGSPSTDPAAPPTGTVSFSVNGVTVGTRALTPGSPTSAQAEASYSTSGLLPGSQTVTATYNGDGNFQSDTSAAYLQQVTCTTNVSSTTGSLHVGSTGSTCVMGVTIGGSVTARDGSKLFISDSAIGGTLNARGPALLGVCGSSLAAITVHDATGFVVIGDPGDDDCAGNTVQTTVTLQANAGGTEVWSNHIGGSLVLHGVTGTGPFPDDFQAEVALNDIVGSLTCQANVPAPTDDGQGNTASTANGQCSAI
jgi:hypothetical protein